MLKLGKKPDQIIEVFVPGIFKHDFLQKLTEGSPGYMVDPKNSERTTFFIDWENIRFLIRDEMEKKD